MIDLCYDIETYQDKTFLCIVRAESPHELNKEDREAIFDLIGTGHLLEQSEGFWQCTNPEIESLMGNSGASRGGQAKVVLEYMMETGYCDDDDDFE